MAKTILCSECGAEMLPEEEMFSWDYGTHAEWLCDDCFTDRRNELSNREFAELIGSEMRPVSDFIYDC